MKTSMIVAHDVAKGNECMVKNQRIGGDGGGGGAFCANLIF